MLLGAPLGCEGRFYVPTKRPTPAPTALVADAEAFWFASGDGTRLRGWFLPSQIGASRDAATILHLHGNAASMTEHLYFVSGLPAAGFNVFLFDYRGYGESDGDPETREQLFEDAKAALRTLRARPDVDPTRIALFGQSLGGAIAVALAEEDLTSGGDLRGVGLESPVASWRDVAANSVGGDPPSLLGSVLAASLVRDATEAVPRPVDAIRCIDRPIFIVHGDADTTVPVSHARRLAAAAPNAELLVCHGGKHNSLRESHPESCERMTAFFVRVTK